MTLASVGLTILLLVVGFAIARRLRGLLALLVGSAFLIAAVFAIVPATGVDLSGVPSIWDIARAMIEPR